MEAVVWFAVGAVAGVVGGVAFRSVGRLGFAAGALVGALVACAGGFAVESLIGDVARVRMSISANGSYGTVTFGLAPMLGAGLAAVAALVAVERLGGARPAVPPALGREPTSRP